MGESILSYKPFYDEMIWSNSRVQCYRDCPYQFFQKYIGKYEEQPQFYKSFGSFMHKIIEQYYTQGLSKEEMKVKFLLNYQKEVLGRRPNEKIAKNYIDDALKYFENFKPFPFNTVAVEKKVEFLVEDFKGNYPPRKFVGIIDYLGEKDGDLYIVDHKSRRLKQRSKRGKYTKNDEAIDKTFRQLYLYSKAVKDEYGVFPKELYLNCFLNGEIIVEPFNEDTYNEVLHDYLFDINYLTEDNEFRPFVEYFNCKYLCGFSSDCCYFNRR